MKASPNRPGIGHAAHLVRGAIGSQVGRVRPSGSAHTSALDEQALVERAVAGSELAWRRLYDDHKAYVFEDRASWAEIRDAPEFQAMLARHR